MRLASCINTLCGVVLVIRLGALRNIDLLYDTNGKIASFLCKCRQALLLESWFYKTSVVTGTMQ